MGDVISVTTHTFDETVLRADRPVLVDFYADWCGPCRAMEPALKDIAAEYEGEAAVVKIDVEAHPDLQKRFGVMGLPSFLLFKEGQIVDRISGAVTRARIAVALEKALGGPR